MRTRPWIYILIGISFGVIDWYYLNLLSSLGRNPGLNDWQVQASAIVRILAVVLLVSLNYGIWLVPVIPVSIFEMKRSGSIWFSALSAVLVWMAAMVSYYSYFAVLLLFSGLPNLDFMLYSHHTAPGYWSDFWPIFNRLILNQFLVWVLIAVMCGAVVGAAAAFLVRRGSRRAAADRIISSTI